MSLALAALTGCTIIPSAPPPAAVPTAQPSTPPPATTTDTQPPGLPPADTASAPEIYAALGQTVTVGGPRVTPLAVVEDSRCPMNARCVWAGQVILKVRIDLGSGTSETQLTSGKSIAVADGRLELVEVQPDKVAGTSGGVIAPGAYRFGFRFDGGY